MAKRFRQADPRWSKIMLGFGPGTIGQSGCALVSLCQAAKFIRGVEFLPPHLNSVGKANAGFRGMLVLWNNIGRSAGLDVRSMTTGDKISETIRETLTSGGVCLIHVDHKKDKDGDHWILAHQKDELGNFICSCSAIGDDIVINKDTLTGHTKWKDEPKTYAVRGVRPVFALA